MRRRAVLSGLLVVAALTPGARGAMGTSNAEPVVD
jgi:hypothetical protein